MASTQPTARARAGVGVGAAVLVAVTACLPFGSAAGQTTATQTLGTGQSQTLDSPGVAEMTPGDGRLAGYGLEARVTGVAFTGRAGGPGQAVQAGAGDQLVVVSVDQVMPDQSRYYAYSTAAAPDYTLTAGSTTVHLGRFDQTVPSEQARTWAAAIPAGSPATLTVTYAGFAQSFDLRAGRRSGTSPAALYRNPTGPAVDIALSATQKLTATGSPADPVTVEIAPKRALLAYFEPGPTLQTPPPPDRAWLIVDTTGGVDVTDASGATIDCPGYLSYPSVYLQTPTGRVQAATQYDLGNEPGNCMADVYAFPVPADLTSATFVVDLDGTTQVTDGGAPVTLRFDHQTAEFTVNPPPLPPAPTQGYIQASKTAAEAPGTPAVGRHPANGPRRRSSGDAWGAVIALIVVVLAAAGATWAGLRRRRSIPARPVTRRPRSLLAAPTAALAGSPPAELTVAPAELGPGATAVAVEAEPAGETVTADHAPAPGPALVVCLLGPPVVEGLRKPIRRRGVSRLLYALALHHDRAVTVEQLRDLAATTDERSEAAETIQSYASILRSSTPEGALPPIGAGRSGYRFDPELVDVDVAVFDTLARRTGTPSDPDQMDAALKALSLVRGAPLAGAGWHGIESDVRDLTTRIERLAADTARTALAGRDARRAEQAIEAGLKAIPASPILWETRMIAAAAGSGYGLHRAWADAQTALGPDAPMLAPTFQRLANGQF